MISYNFKIKQSDINTENTKKASVTSVLIDQNNCQVNLQGGSGKFTGRSGKFTPRVVNLPNRPTPGYIYEEYVDKK